MAGSFSGFDPSVFRDGVRFAMRMGLPSQTSQRVTFRWEDRTTYQVEDPTHRPYRWDSQPVTHLTIADLQVDCAVEFAGGDDASANAIGSFNQARITVTLLDTEFTTLVNHGSGRFPDLVRVDDAIYEIRFIAPPIGLFDVTVYQVHCQARNES